jgi:ParB family transcriptional regulator, chromosome partitioning protein
MPAKKPASFFPTAVRVTSVQSPSLQSKPAAVEQAEVEQAIHVLTPQVVSFQDLPIVRIRPNPFQARTDFGTEESAEDIEELAQSIREHGFVSVLFVRPDSEEGYFQLAYGERRWRAAKLIGLDAIPCRIALYSDEQMEDIGLIENIQRKALNPVDEALALQRKLSRMNPKTGKPFSIRSLASHLGVKKHRIEEPLRLCDIPPDCVHLVRKRPDTVRSAFEIAKLPTVELRQPLIDKVIVHEVNTKEVIYLVNQLLDERQQVSVTPSPQEASSALPENVSSEQRKEDHPQGTLALNQDETSVQDDPHRGSQEQTEQTGKGPNLPACDETPTKSSREDPIAPALSLEQRLWEKKVKEDVKVVLTTIGRWSAWVEEGTIQTNRLREHVQQWKTALQDLEHRLQQETEQ